MSKRDAALYLEDISESIKRIENYVTGLTFEEFARDKKTIDAVVRNLSVIGEAVKSIPEEIKSKHSDIPWNEIIGMRNKVMHEYFSVAEDILWETIRKNLPSLKEKINQIKL
jgi:uncharacterized protein with HEPN domain